MPIRNPLLIIALPGCIFSSGVVRALDEDTVTALALRAQHRFAGDYRVDIQLAQRWTEAFQSGERTIIQLSLNRTLDRWQVTGAYNVHFNRSDPGEEHRLWQRLRYSFDLGGGEWESSLRVEERYFTADQATGGRLRIANSWSHPAGKNNVASLGHEWVYNLNDIGTTIRRGVSQNRLIGGFEHTFASGNSLEFQYTLRYLHVPAAANQIQHQLQLTHTRLF